MQAILIMWLVNKWDSQNIDSGTEFLCTVLEEEIYTKTTEVMAEVLEEHYMYNDILEFINCIWGLVQAAHNWFKEYIKTINLKVGFKKCKTGTCLFIKSEQTPH